MEVWRSMEHLVLDGKVGKSLSLVLMPIQRQRSGDVCGLSALAIQDALLRQCAVSQLIFIQSEMRSHLAA